jgi:small subunit ribosomal protein S2
MAAPQFTMRELMEAGVHFGHKTKRWNPKMAPFLFGIRNDIHIIDLQQTVPMLQRALKTVSDVVANNGRVLFVGTKRQAQETVAENAKRCGQYYVNYRWLGGMLTNWKTISQSIKRLREMEEKIENAANGKGLTKNEVLQLQRERDKHQLVLGGIRDMGGLPDVIFVVDTNEEDIAVKEANKLGIPVIGVLDSNSSPDGINLPVPGNDDSARAISLYCRLISDAVLAGIEQEMIRSGVDMGAKADLPKQIAPKAAANTEAAAPAAALEQLVEAKSTEGKSTEPKAKKAATVVKKTAPRKKAAGE